MDNKDKIEVLDRCKCLFYRIEKSTYSSVCLFSGIVFCLRRKLCTRDNVFDLKVLKDTGMLDTGNLKYQ